MQQGSVIQPGMRVLGNDGGEVGTIDQVLTSPDGQDVRLVLAGTGAAIPGRVISSAGPDGVRLNMSSGTASATQWGAAPSGYSPASVYELGLGEAQGDTITVQRHEERLQAEKVVREVGTVQVQKHVVEVPQTVSVDVAHDEYDVQRVDMERAWQPGDDEPRTEGETIIVPILGEKIEVLRRKIVIGELRMTRRQVVEQRQITDTVKKEVVEVTGPVGGNTGTTDPTV
jgi:uncharacterized protein (TIGR02271 family)